MDSESCATVALYYAYFDVPNPSALVDAQRQLCEKNGITGRIRIAKEGINGTIAGTKCAIEQYISETESIPEVEALREKGSARTIDWKLSNGRPGEQVFPELQVKVAKEIVSLGSAKTKYSTLETGIHLTPEEFHQALEAKGDNALLLDCRNTYEIAIGKFEGALDPKLRSFHTFPQWVDKAKKEGLFKGKEKLFMYCTGGIRCEKATQLVKSKLPEVKNVFQLKGGIHRYLEKYGTDGSFKGLNFVFDERIHQPLPDEGKRTVVGRCSVCECAYDTVVKTRRCNKCRMLVLACDKCAQDRTAVSGDPPLLWCEAHSALDTYKNPSNKEGVDKTNNKETKGETSNSTTEDCIQLEKKRRVEETST